MAMSLDGFITGPHDAENPAGINGMRLMDWLDGVRISAEADGDGGGGGDNGAQSLTASR
jgi:hypothetical protein